MKPAMVFEDQWSLLDSLGVGIVLVDASTLEILFINTEMEQLSMYLKEDVQGQHFVKLFFRENQVRVRDLLGLQPISNETILTESFILMRRRSGSSFNVTLSVKPLQNSKLKLITVNNSQPRRELEIELERVYSQMIQSSKFLSLAEMAAGIAHEINNPLAIIHSYVEQIKMRAETGRLTNEKALQICEKVCQATMRASKIIGTLKKLSQSNESSEFAPVSISEVIGEVVDLCTARFQAYNVELRTPKSSIDTQIHCNSSQLLQVFLNLLENGLHAVKDQEERWVSLSVSLKDERAIFSVEDSGAGVPDNIQTEIMNPFFTTKEVGEGTGLGLSISKTIISKHNGSLYYDSDKTGSCFTIEIPLYKQDASGEKSVKALVDPRNLIRTSSAGVFPSHQASEFRILIVDDEVELVEAVKFGLVNRGYNVLVANDGGEALRLLKSEKVDVLLTDVRMPKLDGYNLFYKLKEELPVMPKVFFFTGSTNIAVDHFFDEGAEGFFLKPVSIFRIIDTIEAKLSGRETLLKRERPRFHFNQNYSFDIEKQGAKLPHHVVNIGRGGMFIEDDGKMPAVGDSIRFSLSIQTVDGQSEVRGSATVRWVRLQEEPGRRRGFGVEFFSIDHEGGQAFFELIDSLESKAFIPAN